MCSAARLLVFVLVVLGFAPVAVAARTGADGASAEPGTAPDNGAGRAPAAVSLFGERLMHSQRYPDGGGSVRLVPPISLADSDLLIGAMKAAVRVIYGTHGIDVADAEALQLPLGRMFTLEDVDYEYRFLLDGSAEAGIGVILVARKRTERADDDRLLIGGPGARE